MLNKFKKNIKRIIKYLLFYVSPAYRILFNKSQILQERYENLENECNYLKNEINMLRGLVNNNDREIRTYITDTQNNDREIRTYITDTQNNYFEALFRTVQFPILRNFEVHLAEHCNLNCFGCNHYSPLANEEYLSIDKFTDDFARMFELTQGNVEYINLLGGEPLLNNDIIIYIEIARRYFLNSRINVVTNGLLILQKNDNFFDICHKNKIVLCITKYPGIQWDKVEKYVASHNIMLEYWEDKPNCKHSWYFPLDLSGKQNAKENFLQCRDANSCIFLRKGRLFTCVIPPNIYHFNKYFGKNLTVSDEDSIDIYQARELREILDFLSKPIPFCRYCRVNDRRFDLQWKKSSKRIEEWT
ncbi:MAG: radical SAM protein [Desulfovibrio sp.]|jgi:organic radical activating enzyme|nr:radical SAM protein [Desulfovibrio sp.]